jgi:hypothetical protein
MPQKEVEMDDNMKQAIENLREKHRMLPTEDVVQTLLSAAIEQERESQQ